jgi:flagellar biosynthesis protein FlhA
MADTPQTADAPAEPGFGALLRRLGSLSRSGGDLLMPFGVIAILAVLVFPMPAMLLDFSLALSITISVLILMTVLFIKKSLEINAFPTILLVTTMLRLSLNLASTRLILENGHTGTGAAGKVIEAFGKFMMGGNFVIGIIVFVILVIVNFIVITKGSGRIAEVAARFALDGMPGKQMAIDADLSAGIIEEKEAKRRRKELEDESQFYGAMDGASKFVRGDAVAGVLITFINVIGGLIIGTLQHGLAVGQAMNNYTILTVGDGLVTQLPALIVSTAAGLLVTKAAASGEKSDKALFAQLSAYPSALGLSAGVMAGMSLLPGIPMPPFLLIAGVAGFLAYSKHQQGEQAKAEAAQIAAQPPPVAEEPISTALAIDLIRLELGYGLLPLIRNTEGGRLTDQIKALRRQLATDVGFIMPSVRIQDNLQLPSNTYVIRVKEVEAGRGDLRPGMLLVMDPRGGKIALAGEETSEPTFGLPAMWVNAAAREEAMFKGYTVVDPPTVITTHLTEVVKDNMPDLLSYSEAQKLLDECASHHQKLVADVVPSQITVGGLQRVLQNLLAERVSIRDLPTILEAISEGSTLSRNIGFITEHTRTRLARQLSDQYSADQGYIPLLTLSPEWEQTFAESLVGQGDDRQLSMAPSRLQEFMQSVRTTFERYAMMGEIPVLLTSPPIRPYVRSIVERFRPATVVMSQSEVHPKARIKTLGQI